MEENIAIIDLPSQDQAMDQVKDQAKDQDFDTPPNPASRNMLGVDVCVISKTDALRAIKTTIGENQHKKIAFLNAHGANIAYGDKQYHALLKNFDVYCDGVGLDFGSKILCGEKFPENLNGTDFIPSLFKFLNTPMKIGLLGGADGVADEAARVLTERFSNHEFITINHGFFSSREQPGIINKIKKSRLDILLVAFGNPIQEQWIAQNCTEQHAAIVMGVGAFFDFTSGRITRCPTWMINSRMEWIYRLWVEPKRMWRRYLLGNPLFLFRIFRQKYFQRPAKQSLNGNAP